MKICLQPQKLLMSFGHCWLSWDKDWDDYRWQVFLYRQTMERERRPDRRSDSANQMISRKNFQLHKNWLCPSPLRSMSAAVWKSPLPVWKQMLHWWHFRFRIDNHDVIVPDTSGRVVLDEVDQRVVKIASFQRFSHFFSRQIIRDSCQWIDVCHSPERIP